MRPSPLYNLIGLLSWPVLRGIYRLRMRGLDNVPAAGGCVVACNRVSSFDPWPLGLPLWPRRQLRFMAKSELFNPAMKPFLVAGGAFKVCRGEADFEAIQVGIDLCRAGEIVAMFPEGTRRKKGLRKKHAARPRTGAARIALGAGVPLVPAAIVGTDRLARLAPIRIAYGPPLALD